MAKVGFDLDDCLSFTSPAFKVGFADAAKRGLDEKAALKDDKFWSLTNKSDANKSLMKPSVKRILDDHKAKGDDVYIVTARGSAGAENLQGWAAATYDVPPENVKVIGRSDKAQTLRELGITKFYGDSDGDIKSAIDAGAEGIRIERSPDSSYTWAYHPGMYGEKIIEGTSGHDPAYTTTASAPINTLQEARALEKSKADKATKLQEKISYTPPEKKKALSDTDKQVLQSQLANTLATNKAKPELEYVTSAQGKMYIGGILVDECYDLQYAYREHKEPIYGYNSKHWDAVLGGNVIIFGSFTINYKHDSYLYSILSKVNSSVGEEQKFMEDAKRAEVDYTVLLKQYKSLQKDVGFAKLYVQECERSKAVAEAKLNMATMQADLNTTDMEERISKAEEDKQVFWAQFSPQYQEELRDKVSDYRDQVAGEDDSLQEALQHYKSELDGANAKVNKSNEEIKAIQDKIAKLESDKKALNNLLKVTNAAQLPEKYGNIVIELRHLDSQIATIKELELEPEQSVLAEAIAARDEVQHRLKEETELRNEWIQEDLNSDPNIALAEKLDLVIKRLEAEQTAKFEQTAIAEQEQKDSVKFMQDALTEAEKDVASKEQALDELMGKIRSQKSKARERYDLVDALASTKTDQRESRPEDFHKFNMYIEYNGSTHKILESCELTGHSHVITQGGSPVREYYQFMARKVI